MSTFEQKHTATFANQQRDLAPPVETGSERLRQMDEERLARIGDKVVQLSTTQYYVEGSRGIETAMRSPFTPVDSDNNELVQTQIEYDNKVVDGGAFVELLTRRKQEDGSVAWDSRVVAERTLQPRYQAELAMQAGDHDAAAAHDRVVSSEELADLKQYAEHQEAGPRVMTKRELGAISVATVVKKDKRA